jgi:hypothetical protein
MYYYHESSHDWVFIMIHFNQSWDDVTWYEIYSYCYSWLKHLKHIYIYYQVLRLLITILIGGFFTMLGSMIKLIKWFVVHG